MSKSNNTSDKKFDKKWFENYWYYYKIHTIAGIFALVILIITVVECANNIENDATVTYMGKSYFNQDITTSFENEMSQYIDDYNNDGYKKVFLSVLTLTDEIKSEQDIAMQQKAQLEIAAGDTYLYLMDEKLFNQYNEQGLFIDISKQLGASEPTFGYLINDSALMKRLGISSNEKIYAAVRVLTQGDEKKPKKVALQENAFKILEEICKKD